MAWNDPVSYKESAARPAAGPITSRDNPLIKEYARLAADAAFRRESGLFALEGARLCADAAASARRSAPFSIPPGRRSSTAPISGRSCRFVPTAARSRPRWPAGCRTRRPPREFFVSAGGLTTAFLWVK